MIMVKSRKFCYNLNIKLIKIKIVPFLKEKIELDIAEAQLQTRQTLAGYSPRNRKLLIFCLVAIIPGYFAAKYLVYFIELPRLQKTALVSTPSFQNPKNPSVGPADITTIGNNVYAVAMQVTNENVDLSLDNAPITFVLYNSQHQQIASVPNTLLLLPAQTKYVVLPHVESTEKITSVDINFPSDLPWQKRLSIPNIPLVASPPNVYNQQDPLAFVVQGTIYNNSPYQLSHMTINFILRNSSGTIIGVSQRTEDTVKPYEQRAYLQLWPNVYSTGVTKVDVLPETDVLDASNLTVPLSSGGAGDLGR